MPPVTGSRRGSRPRYSGIDAFQLDREQLGPIDDLQVQVADAVVAADDIELHVAGHVLELVAEELKLVAAGLRFADANQRVAAAAAVGQAEADFDFVGHFVAIGAGVDQQLEVVVLRELVDAVARGIGREADDFQLHAPRPRLVAERDPLEPEAEDVARGKGEETDRADQQGDGVTIAQPAGRG